MKVRDEVCGMSVDSASASANVEFRGKTYYFCSEQCRSQFVEHPDRYVAVQDEADPPHDGHHH